MVYNVMDIANELLKELNLPVPDNEMVKSEALSQLIEGNIPQSLGGIPNPQKKVLNRQEQLIEDMRSQVKENGKK